MFCRKITAFILIFFFSAACLSPSYAIARAKKHKPYIFSAKSAILIDTYNNKTIFSKNPRLKLPGASTAKLLTAIVVCEKADLEKRVSPGHNALNADPSKANIRAGSTYRVYDLLGACLVASSNDCAIALAESVAGNEADFAVMMNARARKLGATNSHFANATGLPLKNRSQYTTVSDLSAILKGAINKPAIKNIMSQTYVVFYDDKSNRISLATHNKYLRRHPSSGVIVKTGFTRRARYCIVGTNGRFVFAFLSSKHIWLDLQYLLNISKAYAKKN